MLLNNEFSCLRPQRYNFFLNKQLMYVNYFFILNIFNLIKEKL
jgi:hypothetical protein